MSALSSLSDRDLQRKADGLRNRRDAFSFGSRHADEFVQELAQVTREQERRRDERRLAREFEVVSSFGPEAAFCADRARSQARVTGSVSATWSVSRAGDDAPTSSATVRRVQS